MYITDPSAFVEFVPPEWVRPIRHLVLRPHQSFEATVYPGDTDEPTRHAAFLEDDRVVAAASIYRESPPAEQSTDAWRLRGMAVLPEWRRRGAGRAVLQRIVDHARANGAAFVWCNARVSAADYYERLGFRREGDIYDMPPLGPHVFMRHSLE